MQKLYPDIKPNQRYDINVDSGHTLYVEESGTPSGIPVVYLHGGPGAGNHKSARRLFDPEKYRIILCDQRGAGRSKPHASLDANTTEHLINDLEVIRKHLNVEKWVVMGGSWGATLALAYSQAYPQNVLGIILRGVFLGRKQDIEWLYHNGTSRVFPDYWKDFQGAIPLAEQDDLIKAYHNRLTGSDELARMASAKAWAVWEGKVGTLEPNPDVVELLSSPHTALSMARISAHYFLNHCFLAENQILDNMDKIQEIPSIIVHGRYDMICPLENAWTLQNHWKSSELHIVRDAGHSTSEPGIIDALVKATKEMHQVITHDCTDSAGN